MPPPSFTPASGAPQGSQFSSSTLNDLPKQQRLLVRDALQSIRASLLSSSSAETSKAIASAQEAVQKLISDPSLEKGIDRSGDVETSAGQPSTETDAPPTNLAGSALHPNDTTSLALQVSVVIETSLFNIFSDEMDQESQGKTHLLVNYLYALRPILDSMCVVREWWDVLIRPVLKDPQCNPIVARKAQSLAVWAMADTPMSAYVDEPVPSTSWPPREQSVVVAPSPRTSRKPGATPYPASSTRAVSQSRSSEDGDAKRQALFSTSLSHKGTKHQLWRFSQRVFDLYMSEASSVSNRHIEDDDIEDVKLDESAENETLHPTSLSPTKAPHDSGIGSTWKGNLEAIILTFGDQRPKAFFHHLSDSFLEPQSRIPILLLVTIFFRISSSNAYHVVSTPFVRLLVLSLQLDTSKLGASLGIFTLATLIPHIPNWIANGGAGGLPAVLSILARVIDWRKLGRRWEQRSSALDDEDEEWAQVERLSKRLHVRSDIDWKRLDTSSDTATPDPPNAELLFTFLYGIFPCNVIRFLRAPLDYLLKAEYESPFEADWDDIIDENALQYKCAPILRRHILHPSLVNMDAEREITDKQRWQDHDAADITAECVCLNVGQTVTAERLSELPAATALDSFTRGTSDSQDLDPFSVNMRNFGFQATQATEVRPLSRPRSVSDSSGVPKRDLIDHGLSLTRDHLADFTSTPADTTQHASADPLLLKHVRLRYGVPLSNSAHDGRGLGDDALSRSNSARSHASRSIVAPRSQVGQTSSAVTKTANDVSAGPDVVMLPSQSTSSAFGGSAATASSSVIASPSLRVDPVKKTKTVLKEEVMQSIAYLKQENLQLRNELNYEIGQKDQMLRHIGRIHRDRIKDTALEDERQNLYQLVRTLRMQVKSKEENAERSKAEAISFKNRHARWEDELNAKIKQFREEKRAWTNEVRQLQIIKEDYEDLIAKLERQLHENGTEVFELREQCKRDAKKIEAIHQYEGKIQKLEDCLQMWDEDMRKYEAQNRQMDHLINRQEESTLLLQAGDQDRARIEKEKTLLLNRNEMLEQSLEKAKQTIERLQHANQTMLTRTSHSSLPSGSEDEKERLRARVDQLESQLLEVKAQHEEWQIQALYDRLQADRSTRSDRVQDTDKVQNKLDGRDSDVASLHLEEGNDEAKVEGHH